MTENPHKPITAEQLRLERAQYAALRDQLIGQANAVTGKIDLLDSLIPRLPVETKPEPEPEAAEDAPQPQNTRP